MDQERRFAFGENWINFSANRLNPEAVEQARAHMAALVQPHGLGGEEGSFLDIGCGSGLFLALATEFGFQRIVGFDYDPQCVQISLRNLERIAREDAVSPTVAQGDVLNKEFMAGLGVFTFVYAWGSLHHTGSMWNAIENAAARVADNGLFVLAIYNRSITSPVWRWIKWLYVHAPTWGKKGLVAIFLVISALAKAIYTRQNPFKNRRGMDFYHNIVDWVGGYPYEYASCAEITTFVERLGFTTEAVHPGGTPIACNEFVFRRRPA